MNPSDLYPFIASKPYAVISTIAVNGSPQSALIGIAVAPGLEIIFDTKNSSRKYANLLTTPTCSLVIGWEDERTVQYEGTAFLPSEPDLSGYQELYFARWPECRAHKEWPDIAYIVVRPTWLRYSDFSQQPPTIEEFLLPTASSCEPGPQQPIR